MKYIAYWELDPQNIDAAMEKVNQITQTLDQSPNKFGKILYPHSLLEIGYTGFTIIDAQDPSALGSILVMASPEVKINFVPIYDAMEAMQKYKSVQMMMPRTTPRTTETTERFERDLNV